MPAHVVVVLVDVLDGVDQVDLVPDGVAVLLDGLGDGLDDGGLVLDLDGGEGVLGGDGGGGHGHGGGSDSLNGKEE